MILTEPERDSDFLQMHANQRAADIHARLGLDVFHGRRFLKTPVAGRGKASAGFGLRDGVEARQAQDAAQFIFNNERPV